MDVKIEIRAMEEADLDQALDLWKVSFNAGFSSSFDTKDRLSYYLNRNPSLSSVACLENGKLVAALLCGHDGRRGSIYHTAVYNEYRKKGIGRKMEERSLLELNKIGITTGFLFINTNNPGSKNFWQSLGWKVINDVKRL
ncbi:GNAT family N-acetyltransferase [Clostridium sp. 'deep sea']|uniref:GNAT family N-acetyltransferase n=1 Tax=Clostridium sp. 'deep sea' TaxID=2779445 RepID=UPI001896A445|nr:GNAT family N-acetyltransferase [Clostridium sp. 'deep sea']QOR35221.1 GNAT family N-acetyltransferase [Clostridium sp. 'deep sea']